MRYYKLIDDMSLIDDVKRIRTERTGDYGEPSEQMGIYAALVNARFGTSFTASDMCIIEILHKMSRTKKYKKDHFADTIGYSDMAVEINEKK